MALNLRLKLQNGLFTLCCDLALRCAAHWGDDGSIRWRFTPCVTTSSTNTPCQQLLKPTQIIWYLKWTHVQKPAFRFDFDSRHHSLRASEEGADIWASILWFSFQRPSLLLAPSQWGTFIFLLKATAKSLSTLLTLFVFFFIQLGQHKFKNAFQGRISQIVLSPSLVLSLLSRPFQSLWLADTKGG